MAACISLYVCLQTESVSNVTRSRCLHFDGNPDLKPGIFEQIFFHLCTHKQYWGAEPLQRSVFSKCSGSNYYTSVLNTLI